MGNTIAFKSVKGLCLLFYIHEPCFCFPELPCLSSLNSHVKEYVVGRCTTRNTIRRLQTRRVVAVIKHFLHVWKTHMFVQHHRARWHSRSSCPPTTSTLSARESWSSYLKYLPGKKIWENLTWKHFVIHFVHYLPQEKNTKVLWICSNPGH